MSEFARKTDVIRGFDGRGKVRDPILGDGVLYENVQTGESVLCVTQTMNGREHLVREIESKKKRILDKHEYILTLHDYSVEVTSQLCATSYVLGLYYERAPRSLYQEIVDRKSSIPVRPFSMEELTHLLYHQVAAHAFLQERGIAHGDICPQTIALTSDRKFKIAFRPVEAASAERVQFEKMSKKSPFYASPQVYKNLLQRAFDRRNYNVNKSDVFSLGLTILQAGVMKQLDKVYNGKEVDVAVLQNLLDEFEQRYEDNPLLCTTIANFLRVDEKERKDFIEIINALPSYKEIVDYFYNVEHGLINPEEPTGEEDSVGLNDSLPNNFQFSNPQAHYNVEVAAYANESAQFRQYAPQNVNEYNCQTQPSAQSQSYTFITESKPNVEAPVGNYTALPPHLAAEGNAGQRSYNYLTGAVTTNASYRGLPPAATVVHYTALPPNYTPNGGPQQSYNTNGGVQQSYAFNSGVPQTYMSGGAVPQNYVSNATVSQNYPSNGAAPQNYPSNGAAPQNYPSNGAAPQNYPSNGAAPQNYSANGTTPQIYASNGATSQSHSQNEGVSQNAPITQNYPSTGLQGQSYAPNSGTPQTYPANAGTAQNYPSNAGTAQNYPSTGGVPQSYNITGGTPPNYPSSRVVYGAAVNGSAVQHVAYTVAPNTQTISMRNVAPTSTFPDNRLLVSNKTNDNFFNF